MEFLVNDLSVHGQFDDFSTFQAAIKRVMVIRRIAKRFGRELQCHRNIAQAKVTKNLLMPQAINRFSVDQKRALMQWLTRQGPFWEDTRTHGSYDYLECRGKVVTDTAVGEAGYCCFHGLERSLVSLAPSDWQFCPVPVVWVTTNFPGQSIDVENYQNPSDVEAVLTTAPPRFVSWKSVENAVIARYPSLTFSPDAFASLEGHPFSDSASRRILALLHVLHRLVNCFDQNGQRTDEGKHLYRNHFTGSKAWFSDSSETEKNEFKSELTFRHPHQNGQSLFCSWHGKVKTPQIRIHFSWPIRANEPLYIVYVGPKITKQ